MRQSAFFLFIIIGKSAFSQSVLQLEGTYYGKNLYVQNPMLDDGSSFCIDSVIVNGARISMDIEGAAIELPLDSLNIEVGSTLFIKLYHDSTCRPLVLNVNIRPPYKKFDLDTITLATSGLLEWSSSCTTEHYYIVQQYRWNRWVKLDQKAGIISDSLNNYSYKSELHSGENEIRVKTVLRSNPNRGIFNVVKVESPKQLVTAKYHRQLNYVQFSGATSYEIYDAYGTVLSTGRSSSINLSEFQNGLYFINYDVSNMKVRVRTKQ